MSEVDVILRQTVPVREDDAPTSQSMAYLPGRIGVSETGVPASSSSTAGFGASGPLLIPGCLQGQLPLIRHLARAFTCGMWCSLIELTGTRICEYSRLILSVVLICLRVT